MCLEHLAYPIDSAIKAEIALFFATLAAYVETNLALKIGPKWLLVFLRVLSTLPCTARRNAQTAGEDYRRGLRSHRGHGVVQHATPPSGAADRFAHSARPNNGIH